MQRYRPGNFLVEVLRKAVSHYSRTVSRVVFAYTTQTRELEMLVSQSRLVFVAPSVH